MNELEIDKMKPGPELDALVAERVMGWRYSNVAVGQTGQPVKTASFWQDPDKDFKAGRLSPKPYSTDIVATWEVVEHIIEKYGIKAHNGMMLGRQDAGYDPVPDALWYCEFGNPTWQCADGDTAQEAICKAALKAVTNA